MLLDANLRKEKAPRDCGKCAATAATHAGKCRLPAIPTVPPTSPRIPTPPPAIPTVTPTAPRLRPSVRRLLPIVPRLRRRRRRSDWLSPRILRRLRERIPAMLARRIRKLAAFVLVLRLANARCAAHALALCAVPFATRTLCGFFGAPCARVVCEHAQGEMGAVVDLAVHEPLIFVHGFLPEPKMWAMDAGLF